MTVQDQIHKYLNTRIQVFLQENQKYIFLKKEKDSYLNKYNRT